MRSPALFASLAAALLLGVAVGCSSSRPSSPDAQGDASSSGPALSLLSVTDGGALTLHDARTGATDTLRRGVRAGGARAVAPSGRHLAFSVRTADSTRLALLDLTDGSLRRVHARAGAVTYSLAWHPEADRLAFGHYAPAAEGTRGPGGIRVATPDGTHRSVGCSAAREVLAWLPSGALATRNDDRLYLVAPADCATRASTDARRMRAATYAPTGTRLAYIYRELTYKQSLGEYTPDSSLYLSDTRGRGATEVLSPKQQVRHLRWAPGGEELAVDVSVEASGRRQVAFYNVADERTVYLTPPSETAADQTHPRWSPDGNTVAFTLGRGADATAAVRVEGQTRTLGPVADAVWGWTDPRSVVVPGPDSLRVQSLTGTTRYARPAPAMLIHAWTRPSA